MTATILHFPLSSPSEIARLVAAIRRSRDVFPLQVRADDRRAVKLIEIRATEALRREGMSVREIEARVNACRTERKP